MSDPTPTAANKRFYNSLRFPLLFIVVIWLVHIVQFIGGFNFGQFGIFPHSLLGLRGILLAPLIHADFGHLISNSVPMFALSGIIFYFYPRVAFRSFLMIYLLTGLAVWLLGRSVFHVGASGVVYGLVAFVAWNGIFRRDIKSIVLALIVVFFYQGMFAGILPNQEGISWESHLYGALVGIFTSFFYKEELEEDELEPVDPFTEEIVESNTYFLPRNTFEKTRAQREWERRNPPPPSELPPRGPWGDPTIS